MSSTDAIKAVIFDSFKAEIDVLERGVSDYRVFVPFYFDDGDAPKVILQEGSDGRWTLTDEGNTLMRLGYNGIEIKEGSAKMKLLERITAFHFMECRRGRLILDGIEQRAISSSLFTFVQGVIRVGDLSLWKTEHAKSVFVELFQEAIQEAIPNRRCDFAFLYPEIDPDSSYPIDCVVEGKGKLRFHIYTALNDTKTMRSMLSIYHYAKHGIKQPSAIVFDEDADISKRTRNQAIDLADKTFTSLSAIREHLMPFIEKYENAA